MGVQVAAHQHVHHRDPAPWSPKVCSFWLAGRCTRNPCRFLHCAPHPPNGPAPPIPRRSNVWRNPNTCPRPASLSPKACATPAQQSTPKNGTQGRVKQEEKAAAPSPKHCTTPAQLSTPKNGTQGRVKQEEKVAAPSPKHCTTRAQQSTPKNGTQGPVKQEEKAAVPSPKPCTTRAQETPKDGIQHQELVQDKASPPSATPKNASDVEGAAKPGQEGATGGAQTMAACGSIGEGFYHVATLEGHSKAVTGIALPSGSNKLYTASKDGEVRVWDCATGKCVHVMNLGVEIGCLISEGPWMFVGIPNAVKAWNTENGADVSLLGAKGQVHALVTSDDTLFAGAQAGIITAWRFDSAGEPSASLAGHQGAVVALIVGAGRLYSASTDHTIRVWDLANLHCMHTLAEHTSAVMSVLCWDQYMFSCSMDQTVKVWADTESGEMEVVYTHSEEHGLLALFGMPDNQAGNKPVLFVSCNDNSIRLYDLPTFTERGRIFGKEVMRAIQLGPGGLFFSGDGSGELKVWKWATSERPAAADSAMIE